MGGGGDGALGVPYNWVFLLAVLSRLKNSLVALSSNGVTVKRSSSILIYLKPRYRYLYRKMAASLKLNEIRSVIKNGGIFNKCGGE